MAQDRSAERTNGLTPSRLDLRLADVQQLFDSMDPAPFHERALDPQAAAYIIDWAQEEAPQAPLALDVHLGRQPDGAEALVAEAVHEHFRDRALATKRRLRRMFRDGRISLVIGIAFLAVAFAVAEAVSGWAVADRYDGLITESLVIGGWVALWRPMEIFLYDWWPLRAEIRLYERLVRMPVRVVGSSAAAGTT